MSKVIEIDYVNPKAWIPKKRPKKRNVSVPLDEDDIELLDLIAGEFKIDRAVIMRLAIQFASKNKAFIDALKQF